VFAEDAGIAINALIAISYNPYAPKPYSRWTMAGMLDLEQELKVAEEFWDFLGGEGSYNQLLDIFERVGIELRSEIDDYFNKFNK
jgi:type II restriction enzyme